jgi:ornithine--oxo-acid transaminase
MTYVAIEFFSLDELREGSKALHDVLELDLPKMQKAKPEHVSPTSSHICDRCGRDLYASPDKDV